MKLLLYTSFFLAFFASTFAESYHGHKVVRVHPESEEQFRLVEKFIDDNRLIRWTHGDRIGEPVDIVVSPSFMDSILRHFSRMRMGPQVTIQDVGKVIDEFMELNSQISAQSKPGDRYDSYHSLDEIYQWIDDIIDSCGSACDLVEIGDSYEGRPLKVITISQGDGSKPNIWVDGGIHAREWISPPVVLYFIEQVIADMKAGGNLVDRFDWFFLPLINVDGYDYSWHTNRLWRKSRQGWSNTTCVGTDINRNFDFMWMTIGASDDPCSEIFAGWRANSEPETVHVEQYVLNNVADGGLIFLTTHSYSQLWMTPWGYTYDLPENYDVLYKAGMVAADGIGAVYGTEYSVGPASSIIYPSSGTSRDWANGVPKFPYVYTVELRDKGDNGFQLPPDQIRPSVIETWAGFLAMVNHIQPA